ncbi:hypothetical protein [Roseivirga sp.]|uniref:hypothetical protein n=1 Tax=Roseivirga sp. TaxID=1964215 RepID=UPI003B519FAF
MNNTFYTRFNLKTNEQLQEIVDHPEGYQKLAVETAQQVLDERAENNIVIAKEVFELPAKKRKRKPPPSEYLKLYFKEYSWSTFIGQLSLSLFYAMVMLVFEYYSGEDDPIIERFYVMPFLIVLLLLLNNVFWASEFKKTARFFIRAINDTAFFMLYGIFKLITFALFYNSSSELVVSITDLIGVILAMAFISLVFELVIEAFLKMFKKEFTWNAQT